ncbi:MAG: hypothetical protein EOP45_19480 [Sphingobacteriaceae bacterium]|nr:MAG: hypothetical protein EOP45_19480 [Sphingobacteriaceae bacterium]
MTAFTREAALIRSLLNASMMYLIVKICINQSHYSCSCASTQRLVDPASSILRVAQHNASNKSEVSNFIVDQVTLDHEAVDRLDSGSTLRLSKTMIKRPGKAKRMRSVSCHSDI